VSHFSNSKSSLTILGAQGAGRTFLPRTAISGKADCRIVSLVGHDHVRNATIWMMLISLGTLQACVVSAEVAGPGFAPPGVTPP
jgi:hypothetical protein